MYDVWHGRHGTIDEEMKAINKTGEACCGGLSFSLCHLVCMPFVLDALPVHLLAC